MANKLKAYVLRTIKDAAKGYSGSQKERIAGAIKDAAHGTDTGWWNDLIYTADCVRMADRYRKDIGQIAAEIAEHQEEGFAASVGRADRHSRPGELPTLGEIAVASLGRTNLAAYNGDKGPIAERHAEALVTGLRLAVEHLVWVIADDLKVYH